MDSTEVTTVDRGPANVARSAIVTAEPSEIFALVANPHRHHEVDGTGTVQSSVIGPRELRLGDKFRVSMKMRGILYAMTSTVTRLEQDRVVEWRHPAGHRWRWELEPLGAGTTRVTEVFDTSSSVFPPLLRVIGAADRNAEGIEKSLRRLQQRFAPA